MGLLITLVLGGLVGWAASKVMRTDGDQGILMNVVVGIVGAWLGTTLLAPLVGVRGDLVLDLPHLIVAFIGAVILLAIVNLFTKQRIR